MCAGDSITHGFMSANYVRMLMDDLGPRGYEFVNAGISGDLAFNLLPRLDDVVGCRPDVVTVLIGTNDAAAHIDEKWRLSYMRHQRLPQTPTLDWYRTTLLEIVRRLKADTCAQIALLEIPPIGENLQSVHNHWVERHNQAIRDVGAVTGVRVLEVHGRLVALLPPGRRPAPFDGSKKLMARALAGKFLGHKSWNDISSKNNLTILTDQIHLNEVGARVVAELIEEFLVADCFAAE